MTRTAKIVIALFCFLLCSAVIIIFQDSFLPSEKVSHYAIKDGYVSGSLIGSFFEIILDAEIDLGEFTELSAGRGEKIDFIANRYEILTNIFSNIEGIIGFCNKDEHLIRTTDDLNEFARLCQKSCRLYTNFDIVSEDLAYFERYRKDDTELLISHRENEITCYMWGKEASQEEQVNLAQEYAKALGVESYLDFDNPIIGDNEAVIAPARICGLPIVAVSRDVLLDKEEELYVLQYLGFQHPGVRVEILPDCVLISCMRTVLPLEINIEKRDIISIAQAIEALKDNLDSVYIDGRVPGRFDDPDRNLIQVDIIKKITLAYGAVYDGDGTYDLEPVFVFSPSSENDYFWDNTFFVNAITGEVYLSINVEYSATGLNKLK